MTRFDENTFSQSKKKLTEADLLKEMTAYNAHVDEFTVVSLPQECFIQDYKCLNPCKG